jgi:hypothetical protein
VGVEPTTSSLLNKSSTAELRAVAAPKRVAASLCGGIKVDASRASMAQHFLTIIE